jgi:uncharacterized RDD family membrane protein YckC
MIEGPPPPPPGFAPPPPPGGLPPPKAPPGGYAVDSYQPVWAEHQDAFAPAYGGFWIRFAAIFIDSLIVGIVILVLFLAIDLIAYRLAGVTGSTVDPNANGVDTVSRLISYALSIGYFVYFWGMGQTPAMRRLGLQVVDATTGAPIGFGRALLRYVGYVISALACYLGLIWAAFDGRKQGWHDKIAHTVVIRV